VAVIILLRAQGTNCGVIFHEPYRQGEQNLTWIRRFRGACQDWVIRALHRFSVRSVFTIPLNLIPWLSENDAKSSFIPVGANLPYFVATPVRAYDHRGTGATVAVFCVSEPPFRAKEIGEISHAMRCAASINPGLRIMFLGKGTREARDDIEQAFEGMPVEVINLGLCELDQVSRVLGQSDAMLCVRGKLSLRRASALAGIACAVPILAYSGAAQGTPLVDAGIDFVPEGDKEALGAALTRVLTDRAHWQELHDRNFHLQRTIFHWDTIAVSLMCFLDGIRTAA
jgi:glycosyltransferase involved in cell wall biosynthesis